MDRTSAERRRRLARTHVRAAEQGLCVRRGGFGEPDAAVSGAAGGGMIGPGSSRNEASWSAL